MRAIIYLFAGFRDEMKKETCYVFNENRRRKWTRVVTVNDEDGKMKIKFLLLPDTSRCQLAKRCVVSRLSSTVPKAKGRVCVGA